MKRLFYLLALLLLTSCSSTQKILHTNISECTINEVAQPDWICSDGKIIEGSWTAVGTTKISNLGVEYIKSEVLIVGRLKLTKKLASSLPVKIQEFTQRVDIKSKQTIDKLTTDVTTQLSKIVQLRSKLLKYRQVNDTLYALVGVSQNRLHKNVKQVIKNSLKRDHTLWLSLQTKNVQQILDEIFQSD